MMMFSRADFETLVSEAMELLPPAARKRIANVAVVVEDEPSEEDRKREGLADDETLLGLYVGVPLDERGASYGVGMTLPDVIHIYQKPIEEEAGNDPERIKMVVTETVWHEFAHHMGMNEREVREREDEHNGHI